MSVTAGVNDAGLATRAKLRGGIKVGRYWPGKAPKWAREAEEDDDDDVGMHTKVDDLGIATRINDDPRLGRLAQMTRIENREQVRAEHRRVRQAAEVIYTEEEKYLRNQEGLDEEEDVDALEKRRRRRIREKNVKRTQEEADLLPLGEEEDETDSEDDMFGITMIKPVFVLKAERDTVAEREPIEAEEETLEKLAKRKLETKQIVVEEVRKDEEIWKVLLEEANIGDVETDDENNEAYEAWKTREVARIKREKDAKEAMSRVNEEIDKLRNMTEHERENPKPSSSSAKPKIQRKFMQRYYHKGAFFQETGFVETDGIYQRNYSAPTGEELNGLTLSMRIQQKIGVTRGFPRR